MLENQRLVAGELFTAGVCNMNCKYCYIPKTGSLKKVHDKLIEKLESGEYVSDLEYVYGKNMEALALWGTEPTLTLDKVTKLLPKLFSTFKKLKTIITMIIILPALKIKAFKRSHARITTPFIVGI